MMRIATRLFGERMYDQFAPLEAGLCHLLDQLEVLARLLFIPGRGSGRERHEVERRIVERMASDASRMPLTLVKEHGLYLVLEELVVKSRRSCLAVRLLQRPARRQQQTRRGSQVRRDPPNVVHRDLPIFMVEKKTLCLWECMSRTRVHSHVAALVGTQTRTYRDAARPRLAGEAQIIAGSCVVRCRHDHSPSPRALAR